MVEVVCHSWTWADLPLLVELQALALCCRYELASNIGTHVFSFHEDNCYDANSCANSREMDVCRIDALQL